MPVGANSAERGPPEPGAGGGSVSAKERIRTADSRLYLSGFQGHVRNAGVEPATYDYQSYALPTELVSPLVSHTYRIGTHVAMVASVRQPGFREPGPLKRDPCVGTWCGEFFAKTGDPGRSRTVDARFVRAAL